MDEIITHVKQLRLYSSRDLPVKNIFLSRYGAIPQRISIQPATIENETHTVFHVKSVLHKIYGSEGIRNEWSIVRRCFHPCSKQYYAYEQILSLPNVDGILISINHCSWVTNYYNNSEKSIQPDHIPDHHFLVVDSIDIFYKSEHESFVEKFAYDLINDNTLSILKPKTPILRFVGKCKNSCGSVSNSFYLMGFVCVKKPHINDLTVSYGGQDFLGVHNKIIAWLNKKHTSGLVLLHGAPGSGKTHYIRYLLHCISKIDERHLIYVPSDMIESLTGPGLMPLLLNNTNSLLIIEDAEGSLSRSRTSSQSVANILNLSDGLLSDGTQIKILATFNSQLTSLDSALLRPGRLIVEYCFPTTLTIENAQCLAKSIGVSKLEQITEPLSLASVYALKNEKMIDEQEEEDEPISTRCRKCVSCILDDEEE